MTTETAELMAVDALQAHETLEQPHATPEKAQHGHKGEQHHAPPSSGEKAEGGGKDQHKKKKAKKEAVAPASGAKRKGLYDANPVVEGKRQRKKVERLEPVAAIKTPEPTLKQVGARGLRM
jgi:hypothetical protein